MINYINICNWKKLTERPTKNKENGCSIRWKQLTQFAPMARQDKPVFFFWGTILVWGIPSCFFMWHLINLILYGPLLLIYMVVIITVIINEDSFINTIWCQVNFVFFFNNHF